MALAAAQINYDKDLLYRRWATVHGGVYVPVSPETPPNPFLAHLPERELYRMQRKKSSLGVIMVDLDHFKRFNDTFGHSGGDALLSALGRMLLDQVRKEDVACRYGGEEFILILPEASLETTYERA